MVAIESFSIPNFSFFIILGGAALLYFGKIIGDVKVEKYDKLSYYIEGLLFSGLYLFLPTIFSIYIIENFLKIPNLLSILIQLLVIIILSWVITAHDLFRRYSLSNVFKKKLKEKFNELKSKKRIIKWAINKEAWFKSKFGIDYTELNLLAFYVIPIKFFGNKYLLFIFSLITILSLLSVFSSGSSLIVASLASVFTLIILTMNALAYGYRNAYYPVVKLYLDNGEIIKGRILKFGEFVYLLDEDNKIFVNSNKVTKIEESLWKNKKVL